tara:strand:+ start:674 stop:1462 length:789 start_codon:yes stop_codon:yes gene_type:complete
MADRNYQSQGSYDQARRRDRNADWDRAEYQDRNQGYVGRDGLQTQQYAEGPDARYRRGQGEQPYANHDDDQSRRGGWQSGRWGQGDQLGQDMDQYGGQSTQGDYGYERRGQMQDMRPQGGYQGGFAQGRGGYGSDWGDGQQQDSFRNNQGWQGGSVGGDNQRWGQSHRGRGPKNYQRSDDRIYEDVCDRLSDDDHVDASDIEVSVSDREVTLSGEVDSKQAKRHAEDCADGCSGVEHVQNNLRVRKSQSNAATEDATTASEV